MAILQSSPEIVVRPLAEHQLPEADRIFRLAFGTELGLADPMRFAGDSDYIRTRWKAHSDAFLGAELDGELAGSNFAADWGSVGYFGPLTVRPDLWGRRVAQRLLERTMVIFDKWGTRHRGLYTFSNSPKHVALYQKFGFWPQHLTAILSKEILPGPMDSHWTRFSRLPEPARAAALRECRELTDEIYAGLDLTREILAVASQSLGDTVLLSEGSRLVALAVCHCGAGSEAGSGTCYVKFGAARPGPLAARNFERLLDACQQLAAESGLTRFVAGMNLARVEAYRCMLARGFRADFLGVLMATLATAPGYNRPGVFLIDDWR
jgi:GNAT superfamily N-acetyltransferase